VDHSNLDLQIEELEPIAAPAIIRNSNETLVVDPEEREPSLEIEELEPIVAPAIVRNSNETLVSDSAEE
jgi:hypothetical protein